MPKILKGVRMQNCTGCGLCMLMSSLVAKGTHSYSDGFIRIQKVGAGKPFFNAVVDYGQKTDSEEVRDICPENCYDIVEE